jgi:RimJ/RimL family protein N-acetyltransferase
MSEAWGAPPIARPLGDVTTARLALRRFSADDLDELAEVFAQPEVWEFPFGRGFTRDETARFLDRQLQEWEECGFGCWIGIERTSGRVIGFVGLSVPTFFPDILPAVEVGWRLDRRFWGLGYATEGASAALDAAFATLELTNVCSLPQLGNHRPIRVADRLGMRRTRIVELPRTEQRGSVRACVYEITASEWRG